jgi:hypothetical protein
MGAGSYQVVGPLTVVALPRRVRLGKYWRLSAPGILALDARTSLSVRGKPHSLFANRLSRGNSGGTRDVVGRCRVAMSNVAIRGTARGTVR